MKYAFYTLIALLALGVAAATVWLWTPITYEERIGPDGAFRAVVTYRTWQNLVPRMPGQGGDTPGEITVYSSEGEACGTAPVVMIGLYTLDWDLDSGEVSLDRPRTAVWDLAECSMRTRNLY